MDCRSESSRQIFLQCTGGERKIAELIKFSEIYEKIVMTRMAGNDRYNYPLDLLRYTTKQLPQRDRTHYNLWITIAMKAASIHTIENSGTFWKKLERLFAYFLITKSSAEIVARSCDLILQQIHLLRNRQLPGMYTWNQLDLKTRQVSRFRRLIQGNIYLKNPSAARYLMLNLEQRRSQGRLLNRLAVDEVAITVELICPRKPRQGSNWLKEPWSEELRHEWLDKLGNLVLLDRSYNTGLNSDWCAKREVYENNRRGQPTYFLYTTELGKTSAWNPNLCNARQQQLVNQLFEIYDLFDGGQNVDGDREDDDSGGDENANEGEDGDEDEDEPDSENEVIDNPREDEVLSDREDTELCGKTVKSASDEYEGLKCDRQRDPSRIYCRKCHSWNSEQGKQCNRNSERSSPYCENHKGTRDKNNNDRLTSGAETASVTQDQIISALVGNSSETRTITTETTQDATPAEEEKGKGKATDKLEGNQAETGGDKKLASTKRPSSASTGNARATKKSKPATTESEGLTDGGR